MTIEKLSDRWRRERVEKNRPSDADLLDIANDAERCIDKFSAEAHLDPDGSARRFYQQVEAMAIELLQRRAGS